MGRRAIGSCVHPSLAGGGHLLDVVIKNGWVIDGTGAPRRRADVGIKDGCCVDIGIVKESSRRSINAEGKVVVPGFIDVHTHYDAQAFWDGALTPSPFHGVTTAIAGNCGFSIAPMDSGSLDYIRRMLARVEGMPLASLEAGSPWNWSTSEYLDRLEGNLAVNAGFLIGHSTVRHLVMRDGANQRVATDDEITQMQSLLREGLDAGCLGFSTSRGPVHMDGDGTPVPSRWADDREFLALSRVVGEFEGTSLEVIPANFEDEDAQLMGAMSAAARRTVNWNVMFPDAANVDECHAQLAASQYAESRGGRVVGLAMPLPRISLRSFYSGFVLDALPGWAPAMALAPPERLRLLRDPYERAKLQELSLDSGPLSPSADWPNMLIVETFSESTRPYQGRRVSEIAAAESKAPFDALLDIVCADELRTIFRRYTSPDSLDDWKARVQLIRDPRVIIGGSDAGAHLDMLSTFTYTTSLIKAIVRETGLMTLEELIHYLTEVPAKLYGLHDRGVLSTGMAADLVVFEESTIAPRSVHMRSDLPAGAGRLYAEADGIDLVMVNGEEIVAGGELTGALPGSVLRSGRDARGTALPSGGAH
jgi:N-acyl-D-aspartate/D-glutamate deacylase